MKINRRGFMQAIGLGALVAPAIVDAREILKPSEVNEFARREWKGTFGQVGIRKDLSDEIYELHPADRQRELDEQFCQLHSHILKDMVDNAKIKGE